MSKVTFKQFMKAFRKEAKTDADRELVGLFDTHERNIAPHFESCRPEEEWAQRYKFEGPAAQWHGPGFHKGFRQVDVTESGATDSRIWQLLADDAPAFWAAHAKLFGYQVKAYG